MIDNIIICYFFLLSDQSRHYKKSFLTDYVCYNCSWSQIYKLISFLQQSLIDHRINYHQPITFLLVFCYFFYPLKLFRISRPIFDNTYLVKLIFNSLNQISVLLHLHYHQIIHKKNRLILQFLIFLYHLANFINQLFAFTFDCSSYLNMCQTHPNFDHLFSSSLYISVILF